MKRAIVDPYRKGQRFYFSDAGVIDPMDIVSIDIRRTREDLSTVMKTLMKQPALRFRRFFMPWQKTAIKDELIFRLFEEGLDVTRDFIYFSPGSATTSNDTTT